MRPVAGDPAQGLTHVFTIRPGPGRTANDTRAYTTRKPHKKSRLGCGACKTKRVKCDETRPHCLRCLRAKLACQYAESPPGTEQQTPATGPLTRLPNALSRTPTELRLMKHYDVVTSQVVDTITFSNILAGDRSPQYRAMVLDQAKQHPHLMHSMLAVSALHLDHVGIKDCRRDGLAHLQVALPKFRESVAGVAAGPILPHESPHILYSAMMITLHYFCIDSKAVSDSWVFSSSPGRLDWLMVQQGLAPLFGATKKHHTDSFMTPIFNVLDGPLAARDGVSASLLTLCGYTAEATEEDLKHNPYVRPLLHLNTLMPTERTLPNVLKYLRFMASFDKRFLALVSINDHRALLIMSYGFALMCNVELWWTQPRARRDCWAICSQLDTFGDERVRVELNFPASACGYQSTRAPLARTRFMPKAILEEVQEIATLG